MWRKLHNVYLVPTIRSLVILCYSIKYWHVSQHNTKKTSPVPFSSSWVVGIFQIRVTHKQVWSSHKGVLFTMNHDINYEHQHPFSLPHTLYFPSSPPPLLLSGFSYSSLPSHSLLQILSHTFLQGLPRYPKYLTTQNVQDFFYPPRHTILNPEWDSSRPCSDISLTHVCLDMSFSRSRNGHPISNLNTWCNRLQN